MLRGLEFIDKTITVILEARIEAILEVIALK